MGMIFLALYVVIALAIAGIMLAHTWGERESITGAMILGVFWPLWGLMALLDGF